MCFREARLQAPHPHQGPGLTAARCWKRLECSPSVSSGTLENSTLHGSILLCTVLDRWQTACMQCVGEQFEQICYGRHKLRPTHCQLECTKTLCVCTYCPPTRHVACLWCSESLTLPITSHGGGEDQQPHQPFSISLGDTCVPKNYTSVTLVMWCPQFGP